MQIFYVSLGVVLMSFKNFIYYPTFMSLGKYLNIMHFSQKMCTTRTGYIKQPTRLLPFILYL